jgi:hypothetical protein
MGKDVHKIRVYKEKEKIQQVTHWDLDYLSNDEILELYETKNERAHKLANIDMMETKSHINLALLLISIGVILLFGSLFMLSRI